MLNREWLMEVEVMGGRPDVRSVALTGCVSGLSEGRDAVEVGHDLVAQLDHVLPEHDAARAPVCT